GSDRRGHHLRCRRQHLSLVCSGAVCWRLWHASGALLAVAFAGGTHPGIERVANRSPGSLATLEARASTGDRGPLPAVEPGTYLSGRRVVEMDQSDVARRYRALYNLQTPHLSEPGFLGTRALTRAEAA